MSKINKILIIGFVILFTIIVIGKQNKKDKVFEKQEIILDTLSNMFNIYDNTYNVSIDVVIDSNINFVSNYASYILKQDINKNYFKDNAAVTISDGGPNIIIWLNTASKDTYDIMVINHELLHATIYILTRAGIVLSNESEEVFTYELGFLSREFYKHIK